MTIPQNLIDATASKLTTRGWPADAVASLQDAMKASSAEIDIAFVPVWTWEFPGAATVEVVVRRCLVPSGKMGWYAATRDVTPGSPKVVAPIVCVCV